MDCFRCGNVVRPDARFCGHSGKDLSLAIQVPLLSVLNWRWPVRIVQCRPAYDLTTARSGSRVRASIASRMRCVSWIRGAFEL